MRDTPDDHNDTQNKQKETQLRIHTKGPKGDQRRHRRLQRDTKCQQLSAWRPRSDGAGAFHLPVLHCTIIHLSDKKYYVCSRLVTDLQSSERPVRCHSPGCYKPCRCTDRCPPSSHAGLSECGCSGSGSHLWEIHIVFLTAECNLSSESVFIDVSAPLTWALHHRVVVFGPQHRRVRHPDGVTAETDRCAHVDFLIC